ncbi:penicillin-binding protein activator LpoB [Treponema primitia]|uniref:CsgG/HfaB family protein n=1 Tax=Treponema primitia TaxID=88058 RepID=UPI003981602A
MKNQRVFKLVVFLGLIIFFASCVSFSGKQIDTSDSSGTEMLETVTVQFTVYHPLHFVISERSILEKAYNKLLAEANKKYQGEMDVYNINVKGSFSAWNLLTVPAGSFTGFLIGGNIPQSEPNGSMSVGQYIGAASGLVLGSFLSGSFQKITATGDIVARGEYRRALPTANSNNRGIEGAINRTSIRILNELPRNSIVGVLNISSNDTTNSEYVISELEYKLVESHKFRMVDRQTLDIIRSEQNFQMSGEVSDESAVSIGKMLGANIVITGSITGSGSAQRLTIKALDITTAEIITMTREQF